MKSPAEPILSLETATPVCSAAIRLTGGEIREERATGMGVHSELTFVFIHRLLGQAGLEAEDLGSVVVSAGPGSFTGLRVASSAVKGLLFRTDVPLYAVDTLASLAMGAWLRGGAAGGCWTVVDARRNHLYARRWIFESGGIVPDGESGVWELEEILRRRSSGGGLQGRMPVIGTGVERLIEAARNMDLPPEEWPEEPGNECISAVHPLKVPDGVLERFSGDLMKKVAPEHFEPYYYGDKKT